MKYSTQACFLKASVSYILDSWKMNQKKTKNKKHGEAMKG